MELLIGHHMDNGDSSSGSGGSGGSGAGCVAAAAVDHKNNGGAVLTKDPRVEKVLKVSWMTGNTKTIKPVGLLFQNADQTQISYIIQ